ncbi:MAG: PHP-associated domain-containing protein [Candidatus Merdivicinus sp.]|jgi:predicted metal-dependent phosphoesterase TrpH
MYRMELHCHTQGVSKCAEYPPEKAAELYIEEGYAGVVVTDHMNRHTFSHFDKETPWEQQIEHFMSGYRRFHAAAGDRLTVLLGMELRFDENDNDYLVYGADEEFLLHHPEMMAMKPASFAQLARQEGLLFYQAHPFRDGMTVIPPQYLDGIEVWNGHPNHDSRNEIALAWAEKFGLKQIGGSDFHFPEACGKGGIVTERPILDIPTLLDVLKNQQYEIYRG